MRRSSDPSLSYWLNLLFVAVVVVAVLFHYERACYIGNVISGIIKVFLASKRRGTLEGKVLESVQNTSIKLAN